MHTRRLVLEHAGHTVVEASSEPEVLNACADHTFDVAVIGQSLGDRMKRHVYSLVKEHCPEAKVLELIDPYHAPILPSADDWLETHTAVPSELPERVSRLASGTGSTAGQKR